MNELQLMSMRPAGEELGISTTAFTVTGSDHMGCRRLESECGGAPCLRLGGEPSARQLLGLLILELGGQPISPK